jgi:hypothetical protein
MGAGGRLDEKILLAVQHVHSRPPACVMRHLVV